LPLLSFSFCIHHQLSMLKPMTRNHASLFFFFFSSVYMCVVYVSSRLCGYGGYSLYIASTQRRIATSLYIPSPPRLGSSYSFRCPRRRRLRVVLYFRLLLLSLLDKCLLCPHIRFVYVDCARESQSNDNNNNN
jgi:hypothetical protein